MTWLFTLSIAPLGRWSTGVQPIVGMLNCMSGVRALTSAPFSFANGANGRPAFGSVDRSTGPVSFVAAAHAAGPTFCWTCAWVTCSSWPETGAVVDGAGVGALGAGD